MNELFCLVTDVEQASDLGETQADPATGAARRTLTGHTHAVEVLAAAPDGSSLVPSDVGGSQPRPFTGATNAHTPPLWRVRM